MGRNQTSPVTRAPPALTLEVQAKHVGDVEHAGIAADAVVLLDLGAVVDRHVPAAEVHHAGAGRDVRVEEWCSQTHVLLPGGNQMKKGGRPRRPAAPLSCDLRDRAPVDRRRTPSVGPSRGRSPEPTKHRRSFA